MGVVDRLPCQFAALPVPDSGARVAGSTGPPDPMQALLSHPSDVSGPMLEAPGWAIRCLSSDALATRSSHAPRRYAMRARLRLLFDRWRMPSKDPAVSSSPLLPPKYQKTAGPTSPEAAPHMVAYAQSCPQHPMIWSKPATVYGEPAQTWLNAQKFALHLQTIASKDPDSAKASPDLVEAVRRWSKSPQAFSKPAQVWSNSQATRAWAPGGDSWKELERVG